MDCPAQPALLADLADRPSHDSGGRTYPAADRPFGDGLAVLVRDGGMGLSDPLRSDHRHIPSADAAGVAALGTVIGSVKDASVLIEVYGSLGNVLTAPSERLSVFVERSQARTIAAHGRLLTAVLKERVSERRLIGDWKALADYLRHTIGHSPVEHFRALYLDPGNRLIADEMLGIGTFDSVEVLPREVLAKALLNGAAAMILAHNHPSGNAEPSEADVRMTRRIMALARELDIAVHDHIIVTRQGQTSLRGRGLMRP